MINFFGNYLFKNKNLIKCLLNYKSSSLRIVYYHMISESNPKYYFYNKSIKPSSFKEHLFFLKKHFDIISFQEMIYLLENNKSFNKKLLITTDDGFYENFKYILPITDELKLKFTSFLITSCIDNSNLMWRNKLIYIYNNNTKKDIYNSIQPIIKKYELKKLNNNDNILNWSWKNISMKNKELIVNDIWENLIDESVDSILNRKKPYLNKNQIKEILNNGNYIGSHSHTHPDFSRLTLNEAINEISISNDILIKKFNLTNIPFSFPFGKKKKIDGLSDLFFLNRNYLNNTNSINYYGRDNLEFSFNEMILRLTVLPIFRNIFNNESFN